MKLATEDTAILGKAFASLVVVVVIWCSVKYAFAFTWPQAFVITWLYCLLKDAVIKSKN